MSQIPDPWLDASSCSTEALADDGSESYLVRLLERKLTHDGISFALEQTCGDSSIRADVVTQNAVIEFKRELDRSKLYQARGQAETYAALLGKSQVIVVGRAPSSETEELRARRIAEDLKNAGCHVVFADPYGYWLEDVKALLKTAPHRTFKLQESTFDDSRILERIDVLDSEIQQVRSLIAESHNYLFEAIEQSAHAAVQPARTMIFIAPGFRLFLALWAIFATVFAFQQHQQERPVQPFLNRVLWECQNGTPEACKSAAQALQKLTD